MKLQNLMACICGTTFILSGCTTTNPYTGAKEYSDATVGTSIGAAGGAVMGALFDGGKGAFIGGTLGAMAGGMIGHGLDRENEELRKVLAGTGVQVRRSGRDIQLVMASDVTFNTNQSDIQSNFFPVLNSVAIVFKKYHNNTINITGFTDSTGNENHNQILSEQRARSVGNYLAAQGLPANRIFTTGKGMRNPVASNTTVSGRALNRRVMITLRSLA